MRLALMGFVLLLVGACTVDVPGPPGILDDVSRLLDDVQNRFEDAVADPLGSKPYPVLMGGDDAQILYATNLGDIRLNFRGPTNDVVIPGLLGPSNVYTIRDRARSLLRPLIVAGAFTGLATDGEYVAQIALPDAEAPGPHRLLIGTLEGIGADRLVFEVSPEKQILWPELVMDEGRAVFRVLDLETGQTTIRVATIDGVDEAVSFADADVAAPLALNGTRLAQAVHGDDGVHIMLRDVRTGEEQTIAELAPAVAPVSVVLSDNKVVWGERIGEAASRVTAYDVTTGQATVWLDGALGKLVGATDTDFATEELVQANSGALRNVIRRYDAAGKEKRIAEFRADGLAGQTRILGHRIVYVNDERRIVEVPLVSGGRRSYSPY